MRLVTLATILAICQADLLNRSYLPPVGAKNAGGSDGAISVPVINQRTQNEQIQRQPLLQNINNNNQYQTPFIKPVFQNQISSNVNGQSNNIVRFGTNFQTNVPLNSYGETITDNANNLLRGDARQYSSNGGLSGESQKMISRDIVANDWTKTNQNSTVLSGFENRKNVYQKYVESDPNLHNENNIRNGKPSERGASILRLDKQMASDAYSYSFETENGISAVENAVLKNGIQTQGGYSYTGDDGQVYSVRYIADASGYRPIGNHLPTPPPVPEEILKSIEDNAKAIAAGKVDNGFYHEQRYNPENVSQGQPHYVSYSSGTTHETSRSYLPPINSVTVKDNIGLLRKYLPPKAESENKYNIVNNESSLKLVQPISVEIFPLVHGNAANEASKINVNETDVNNVNRIEVSKNSNSNSESSRKNSNIEKIHKTEEIQSSSGLKSDELFKPDINVTPSILEKKVDFEEGVTPYVISSTEFPSSNVVIPFPTLFTPKQQLTTPKEDESVEPIIIHKPKDQNNESVQNIESKSNQLNLTQKIPQADDQMLHVTSNHTSSVTTGTQELIEGTITTVPISMKGYQYNHPQDIILNSHPSELSKVQSIPPVPKVQDNLNIGNTDSVFVNTQQFQGTIAGSNQKLVDKESVPKNILKEQITRFKQPTILTSNFGAKELNQNGGRETQPETFNNIQPISNVENYKNTNIQEINRAHISGQIQSTISNNVPQIQQKERFEIGTTLNYNTQNQQQNSVSTFVNQQDTSLRNNFFNKFTSNQVSQVSSPNTNAASELNKYSSSFNSGSGNLVQANAQQTFEGANQAVITNNLIQNSDINTRNNNERVHQQDNYIHHSNLINNLAMDQKYRNDGKISANHQHAISSQYNPMQSNSLFNNQVHVQTQYQSPLSNTYVADNNQHISQFDEGNQGQYVLSTPQEVTPSLQRFPNKQALHQNGQYVQNNIAQSSKTISLNNQQYSAPVVFNINRPPSQNRLNDQGYIYNLPANLREGNLNSILIHNNNEYRIQNSNSESARPVDNMQGNDFSTEIFKSQLHQQQLISQPRIISNFYQNQSPQPTLSNHGLQMYNNAAHSNLQPNFQVSQPTTINYREQHQNQQSINHNDANIKVNSEHDRSHSTVSKSQANQKSDLVTARHQKLTGTTIQNGANHDAYSGVLSPQLQPNGQYTNNRNNQDSHVTSLPAASAQGQLTRNSGQSPNTVPLNNSEQFPEHRRLPSYSPVSGYRY